MKPTKIYSATIKRKGKKKATVLAVCQGGCFSPGKKTCEMTLKIVIPQYLWEDFANAIIVQAANDYRKAREKLHDNPEDRMAIAEKKSIERFFHSNWYEVLTTVDGQYILNRLNNEPPGYYPNKTKPKEERKRNR